MVDAARAALARRGEVQQHAWVAVAATRQGAARRENQDAWSIAIGPSGRFLGAGIFDGVGGAPFGRQASHAAAAALPAVLGAGHGPEAVLALLNREVLATGGSSTAVVLTAGPAGGAGGPPQLCSVGDSAAYAADGDGRLVRLTPSDGGPDGVILDCLGRPDMQGHLVAALGPDLRRVLLCTDGVDGVLGAAALLRGLDARVAPAAAVAALIRAVDDADGSDDATVVLATRDF